MTISQKQNKIRFKTVDIVKGIAMIMVILVHYNQNYSPDIPLLRYFQMGCPMFFVASGFGIAYLISRKYPELKEKKDFYKSRFNSIAIPWYLALIIIYIVNTICLLMFNRTLNFGTNRSPLAIIINILFLHGFVPSANNTVMPGGWYVGTTAILYFLSPYIFKLIKDSKNRIITFLYTSFISLFLLVLMRVFFENAFNYNGFGYFSFLNHYPSYYLGMMLYFDYEQKRLSNKQQKCCLIISAILIAIAIFLFLTNYVPGGSFFSSWITALATYLTLYAGMSYEAENTYKSKILNIISKVGSESYCIYLFHAFFAWTFVKVFRVVIKHVFLIDTNNYIWHVTLSPLVVVVACAFGLQTNRIIKKIRAKI